MIPTEWKHPAKWSQPVLDELAEIITTEHARIGSCVMKVLDPFAGVGRQRLAKALSQTYDVDVTGVDIQPECALNDPDTWTGSVLDVGKWWPGVFDAIVTSPVYGNRLADKHVANDPCKVCRGEGVVGGKLCHNCKGSGLSYRGTYAHTLRAMGGDLVSGSAAGIQWGDDYRAFHRHAIQAMITTTRSGGLLVINMSNHIRGGVEQPVVEWWIGAMLEAGCSLVDFRRVQTRRNRRGANGTVRVASEAIIVARAPEAMTRNPLM